MIRHDHLSHPLKLVTHSGESAKDFLRSPNDQSRERFGNPRAGWVLNNLKSSLTNPIPYFTQYTIAGKMP